MGPTHNNKNGPGGSKNGGWFKSPYWHSWIFDNNILQLAASQPVLLHQRLSRAPTFSD